MRSMMASKNSPKYPKSKAVMHVSAPIQIEGWHQSHCGGSLNSDAHGITGLIMISCNPSRPPVGSINPELVVVCIPIFPHQSSLWHLRRYETSCSSPWGNLLNAIFSSNL